MPENFREHVDVASSIKGILDSYPGNSILRELLQNSDDAGASTQIYVLDTRTHSKDSVIDPVLKDTQGPALLAWNDSVFKDSDWAALSTIRGSNKTADETKTGKYGLGFRAVYHVTDNPHVLSGNKLVIFDPHEEFSGSIKGGVQINIQQDGSKYCDQLAAFDSAVPMLDACVDSTISTSMHIEDMKQFFEQFIVNELGVALLFLQHVTSIQLREVTPEGQDVFLAEVKITDPTISARRSSSRRAASASAFICPITTRVHDVVTACVWRICHSCSSPIETSKIMSARLSYDVGEQLKEDKLFAHVAFAIPLKEEKLDGRLFTLLPLPIVTNFPAHMHAIFALTPDRQCLRNEKEMGIGVKARERFLAVWNRILFEEFAPTTWANMLNTLIYEDGIEDAWSAWPPSLSAEQAGDVYWGNMLVKMLIQVIHRDLPVFPTMSERTYVSSSSVVFAEPDQDVALLSALTRAGIYIVQPPLHIYQLLNDTGLALQCAILSRKVVHAKLLCRTSELAACSDKDKNIILDYFLVPSPPDLDSVVHLPIIPLVRGSWTALSKATLGRHKLIMVTDEEATLFGECEPEMIALSSMSPEARHALYCSSALQYLNVADLGAETVHKFLFSMFGRLDPEAEAVPISDSPVAWDWYIRFWAWLNGRRDLSSSGKTNQGSASQKATPRAYNGKTKGKKRLETPRKDLIPTIGRLHLLPTSAGLLRTVQSGISLPGDVGIETMSILTSIGICFLDPLVAQSSGVSILSDANIAVSSHDISFMLNNIDASLVLRLDRGSSKLLQGFLVECLQIHPTKLNKTERAKMMLLPVFPIRVCPSSPSEIMAISTLGPATGDLIFLQPDVADDCPLPKFQRTTTFIELAPETHLLASSLEENAAARACNELKVLELAIPHLGTQPLKLLDGLISRIIPRLLDLSQSAIDCLKRTKFIPVRGGIGRFTPTDIIDPQSDIATLFSEHDAKFPSGMFESGRFLSMMQAQDFFKSKLDPGMVSECIKSISSLNSTQLAATRAKSLLRLLDQAWCSSFASCLVSHDKWLPTDGGSLCCRTRCRDRDSDVYLFDMVLSVMEVNIAHPDIRSALGWSNALPFDVIHSQLSSTLGAETIACRGERLAGLISYMADQWKKGVMTNEDIAVLKDIVLDCPWIPLSSDHLLLTRQALLARDARIGASFRSLPRNLATGTCGEFLRHMGCVDRPSLESLLVELAPSETKQTIHNIIELLEEISCHTKHGAQVDTTNCILVPDHLGHLRPYHDVYYDDLKCGQSFVPEHGFPTHPSVSRLLAVDLCLRFLSGLQLGEDEDEDEDDVEMREELRTRISSVLHDYDIKYSFNEIMANASDAGASSVSVLLDERSFDSNSILTLDMARFQRAPSIVLHNDGTFSQEDFDGFRSIGIGGKSENPDSIGRFGLGALAMYHFSEVVMVVSGQYLMILDPSARYLPLRKGRRRTCVFRPLSQIAKRYPDLLKPFDGLFGFSTSITDYHGTIFRLPLRGEPSLLSSQVQSLNNCINLLEGSYYELARNALFFTCLKQVMAYRQPISGERSLLWSVCGERMEPTQLGAKPTAQFLRLQLTHPNHASCAERWLITSFTTPLPSVPPECKSVPQKLRIRSSKVGLIVRLAFPLDSTTMCSRHYLFSGLRLPQETLLPVHVDAKFAISTDRRSIRFDPPDGAGMRIPESVYNMWILSTLVPELYMYSLSELANIPEKQGDLLKWWPRQADDSISREVVRSFYSMLPKTTYRLCPTAAGNLVSPCEAVFSHLEPRNVSAILITLALSDYVRTPAEILPLMPMDALRTATACYVGQSLERPMISATLRRLFSEGKIGVSQIDSLLRYLLDGQMSLLNLPLIVRADRSMSVFQSPSSQHACTVYDFPQVLQRCPNLFPSFSFIHPEYGLETVKRLVAMKFEGNVASNVRSFDGNAVVQLLHSVKGVPAVPRCQHSEETSKWIQTFWACYNSLPDPPSAKLLEDYPLIRAHGQDHVSIKFCQEGKVLPDPGAGEEWVVPIMNSLNIPVLRSPPPVLQLPFTFTSFLKAITPHVLSMSLTEKLQPSQLQRLAQWIRTQFPLHLTEVSETSLRDCLRSLPLWPSRKGGYQLLLPANELRMLPADVPIEIASKFLCQITITEYSLDLIRLWTLATNKKCRNAALRGRALSASDVSDHLVLRSPLEYNELGDYITLIRTCLVLSDRMLKVPDGNLTLVPVAELYDKSIPLFSAAFQTNEASRFVHPSVRDLQSGLRSKGLQYQVTYQTFEKCAAAIHTDVERSTGGNLGTRVATIYEYYECQLPSLIMRNNSLWASLDNFRFVRRQAQRYLHASYDVGQYCSPLPDIVSPAQLVRKAFERIAWTQRGLFQRQPADNLVAVNPSLGVPRPAEVVAHLGVLSLKIAPHHTRDASLLKDLRETYAWLNSQSHQEELRIALLKRPDDALFLNVDDPQDEWAWCSAKELVFNLHYDENGLLCVRDFLQPYRSLLLAAGAHEVQDPKFVRDREETTREEQDSGLRAEFNRMRMAGQLTDMIFIPTSSDGGHTATDKLRVHSAFLAATIPHINAALVSGWAEWEQKEYPFLGSFFGASAVIDFVYTGEIQIPDPTDAEEASDLLDDLLQLLAVADRWDMGSLKTHLEWLIAERFRLVNPVTCRLILKDAETYSAASLVKFCKDYMVQNCQVLNNLST